MTRRSPGVDLAGPLARHGISVASRPRAWRPRPSGRGRRRPERARRSGAPHL